MIFIGIDPGKSGGIAVLRDYEGCEKVGFESSPEFLPVSKMTEHDLSGWLWLESCRDMPMRAVIEKVSSSPQMGVVSAFTFGSSYGFLRGLLTALKIPYATVTPQKWQKAMGCLTKGDKNVSKSAAQRLYPNEKVTHAVADALLLATYCKRHHAELF